MGIGHQGRLAEHSERDKETQIDHLCCVPSSVSMHHLLAACDLQQGTLVWSGLIKSSLVWSGLVWAGQPIQHFHLLPLGGSNSTAEP
jgi:hypothetical protein